MSRFVRDDGSKSARLVLIGDQPDRHAEGQGRPFVGWHSQQMAGWWQTNGLSRRDFYLSYFYPYRFPLLAAKGFPKDDHRVWTDDLHDRIAALHDPWLIVPTGNTALKALTGKWGITRHRGSIYEYIDRRGRRIKVIPALDSSTVAKMPAWERRCVADWRRIEGDSHFRDLRTPEREHFIRPTLRDVRDYLEDVRARAECLSVDIETPRSLTFESYRSKPTKKFPEGKPRSRKVIGRARITCIGFSHDPGFGFVIPTTESYWGSEQTLEDVWELIRELLATKARKLYQNGFFDNWWLTQPEYAAPSLNWVWDTKCMHQALDITDTHSLQYMASVDTREPYWKDEAKDPDEIMKYASDLDAFHTYNSIDVTVQRELGDVYAARLAADGRLQWYMRHFAEMFGPILRMSRRGVLLDEERRKRRHALLTVACMRIKQRLGEIAGAPLHGPKDLVPKKVAWYLYEQMRLPRQLDRKSGKPTTKEVVIRKLMLRFPDKMGKSDIDAAGTMKPTELKDAILAETKPGPLILAHRRKFKLSSFLREGIPDADHRVRSAYAFVSTLRLSSSKNPARTGQNNQNIDREIRDCYLPDPGLFFGETDCSQGESRIVYCLSGDPELVEIARTQPWEFDDHNRTAGIVFTCPSKGIWPNGMKMFDVTPDQRYFGKRTRHASNYGMHGNKMSEELLKEGIIRDPDECDRWIDALLQRDKAILYWQTNVRKKVLRDRCIGNSWGHVIDFTWERLGDDLYRKAYAAQPQSELGMLLNQYGFKVLDGEIQKHRMKTRINMQNHDALLYSTCLEECYDVMTLLQTSLAQPRVYNGVKLSMPVENKVGINWKADKKIGEGMEFKRLPDRDEFNSKVREFLRTHALKAR